MCTYNLIYNDVQDHQCLSHPPGYPSRDPLLTYPPPRPPTPPALTPPSRGRLHPQKPEVVGRRKHSLPTLFGPQSVKTQIKTHPQVFLLTFRSNAFFIEMANFIITKTSTQCRSYHQKYEIKHKYPHRIIRQEMEKIDRVAYSRIRKEYVERNQP